MQVIYTRTAARQIESLIAYLVSQHAGAVALRARARIESFVAEFLTRHPRAGTHIPEKGIYEVLVYRIDPGDVLRILALYHTSQDRSGFDPRQSD